MIINSKMRKTVEYRNEKEIINHYFFITFSTALQEPPGGINFQSFKINQGEIK